MSDRPTWGVARSALLKKCAHTNSDPVYGQRVAWEPLPRYRTTSSSRVTSDHGQIGAALPGKTG